MPVVIHGINVQPLIMSIIALPYRCPYQTRPATPRDGFPYRTFTIMIKSHILKLKLWLPLCPILLGPLLEKAQAKIHSL